MFKRMLKRVTTLGSPDYAQIDDGIFIGNVNSVYDMQFLTSANIKLIINASNNPQYSNALSIPTIRILDMQDVEDTDVEVLLRKAKSIAAQIDKVASRGHNVLIHCYAGINRSAFMLAYYLIVYRGHDPKQCIESIKHTNKIVRATSALTNTTFEQTLLDLKKTI